MAPFVGNAIERYGGRPLLAASAVLLASGLAALALAPTLPVFVLAWLVIGLGMGAGLYDAAFSTLGRLYGMEARRLITYLTLFGGFASTICWPLSALLETEFGWRGACGIHAAIQLFLVLPLVLIALPREQHRQPKPRARPATPSPAPDLPDGRLRRRQFILIASAFTISSAIASVISVHLLTMRSLAGSRLARPSPLAP